MITNWIYLFSKCSDMQMNQITHVGEVLRGLAQGLLLVKWDVFAQQKKNCFCGIKSAV